MPVSLMVCGVFLADGLKNEVAVFILKSPRYETFTVAKCGFLTLAGCHSSRQIVMDIQATAMHRHTPKLTAIDSRGLALRLVDYYRAAEEAVAEAQVNRTVHDLSLIHISEPTRPY